MNETQEVTLESLQVGDTAYVQGMGVYSKLQRVTITKVTETQITTSDGRNSHKFRRADGRGTEKLDRFDTRDYLRPSNAQYTARYEKQENLALIERANMKALSDEQLAAIAKVLRGE